MAEKLFYTMGEVSEMFDVKPSLIRHWESQFDNIRPQRNKKGNRLFSPKDVELLKVVYHLVRERGMTLSGAKRVLKQQKAGEDLFSRDALLMEHLQKIRALLLEVREELKESGGEELPRKAVVNNSPVRPRRAPECPVLKFPDEEPAVTAPSGGEPSLKEQARRSDQREYRDADDRELFAFYEQSLF